MFEDPIVEELHRIRREHAARFDNDISRIVEDIQRMERESGRTHVNFPPRRRPKQPPARPPITSAAEYEKAQEELRELERRLSDLQQSQSPASNGHTKAEVRLVIARIQDQLTLYEGAEEACRPEAG